ncbi:MAG: rhomboid family intramembrane serine protease [Planctomycetota bacterium]|jgi:membrane associated rhomboid family serine protease
MGLYDRDYTRENFQQRYQYAPQMRVRLPQITPMVKCLLLINIAVYIVQALGANEPLMQIFSLYPASLLMALQLWRLVTYQFLHGGLFHILFNMLCLFFLGSSLERHWGSKRFLKFYLGCGIAGGLFYLLLVTIRFLPALPMIGASGAVLGLLAACAILFPQFIVFIFLFPVPIRVAAIAFTVIYFVAVITRSPNAGGDAAHLAGMAAGTIYVLSQSWRANLKSKNRSGRWEKKITTQRSLQVEVDRILEKVHNQGIRSLTAKEKKLLKKATEAEQKRTRL